MATETDHVEPPQETPDRPPKSEFKRVKYIGQSDVRRIRASQLEAVGITISDDLVWSAENDFSIAVKGIPADLLDLLAMDTQDFVLE